MPNMASVWVLGLSVLSFAVAQNTIQLQFPDSSPNNASGFIDPSFAGFGIEPSNFFSFTGYDQPNELTFNLIENLRNYTGAPPHMRIGGNTQDYMVYSEDQQEYTWILNPNATGQGNFPSDHMLIGPKFFEVANRFPRGTPVTWGLNLAYQNLDYKQRLVTMAQQVVKSLPNLKVVSLEIGNEPDLYAGNGFRSTGPWGGDVYIREWLDRATTVYEEVLKPINVSSNFFEPGTTANTIGTSFEISDMTTLGVSRQANDSDNSYIASWNQHDYFYYIGVSTYPLTLETFTELSRTNEQFKAWEKQIMESKATPYPYALREMCSVGPIGMEGVTNTFGNALWTLNFFMYAASLNITTVQMHMTDNSNASAWQPLEMYGRKPFVRPSYYGYAAFDQIIGPSCEAQVARYDLGQEDRVKAYTVYQAGELATIVVINARMANVTDPVKSNATVELSLPTALAGRELHLAYLTNQGIDATSGTTWNGISYEQSGNGRPTTVDDSDRTVTIAQDGSATFTVRDSEAIAANIGSPVGSGAANTAACAAIAARSAGIGPTPLPSPTDDSNRPGASAGSGADGTSGGSDSSAKGAGSRVSAIIFTTLGTALATGALLLWI